MRLAGVLVAEVTRDFDAFVNRSYRPLVRTAYLMVGDWHHAEDLVQSALAKTAPAWRRLESDAAAYGYSRTVLVRMCTRWWRRKWHGETPTQDLPELADREDDPELRAALLMALGGLPAEQRAAVVLRYWEDLSEADTAEALGCAVGTVKSRTSRGLAALRSSSKLAGIDDA
jgi:RNA polymerase sigma-70 factor (sigma-E family)